MKKTLTILIILLISCNSYKNLNVFIKNRSYVFSDNSIRKLKITFLNDTIIEIKNDIGGLHYYPYSFSIKYSIEKIDYWKYVITKTVDKTNLRFRNIYIHPYRNGKFIDYKDIFPDVIKDTIFFDVNYKKLLLKDFCFNYNK